MKLGTMSGASSLLDSAINFTNSLWGIVGASLFGDSAFNLGIDNYESAIASYGYIFRLFAYSLVVLLFGINVIENALKYELFTTKGAVSVLGRLLFAKVWIDLSTTICLAIIRLTTGLAVQLTTTSVVPLLDPPTNISSDVSNIPVIGELLDLILALVMIIPMILVFLIVGFSAGAVVVKVTLRSLELTMLLVVAPMFFACSVADATKEFFKKFITTFISVSMQLVYMSIVYVVGLSWLQEQGEVNETDVGTWLIGSLPALIILISLAIMMVKPPKSLTSLVS